jgi:hypothetical protein
MVQSNINQNINYIENIFVYPEDKNKELTVHDIKIYGISVSICIGIVQNRYSASYGVLYCPIYLVKPNGRVTPIGVFEFKSSKQKYLKDEFGEFDISKLSKPLLFSFSTIDYISRIIHGIEKHKLEIDEKVCENLKKKEEKKEEYIQIIKQEREREENKKLYNQIADLSTNKAYQKK